MKKFSFVVLMTLLVNPGIDAQESYLDTHDTLKSSILFEDYTLFQAFDMSEWIVFANDGDTIRSFDFETKEEIRKYGMPDESFAGSPSFLSISPNGKEIWAGYTVWGTPDDRVYVINIETGIWKHVASLTSNFDLAFWDNHPFVSGLNSPTFGDPNGIWILDTTGADKHRLIINTGGYSAGFDIDDEGNLIYGTSGLTENLLLKWDNSVIEDEFENDQSPLDISDATKLSVLSAGSYDCTIDEEGNIAFNVNNFVLNFIGIWNGSEGDGFNYDTLASSPEFLTHLSSGGDITQASLQNNLLALAYGTNITETHYDIPPTISNPILDFNIPRDKTDATKIDLFDVFHDDDDHDSMFRFTILDNSHPELLECSIENHTLIIDLIGLTSTKVDIIIEGKTHLHAVNDSLSITVIYPVGIQNHDLSDAILVYPNPATEYLRIKAIELNNSTLSIYNMSGKVVFTQEKINSNDAINISELNTGSYLIQIKNQDRIYQSIFIKE